MISLDAADLPHAVERGFIAEVPPKGVAGIGRVHDDAAVADNLGRAVEQPQLRIDWMDFEVLTHTAILGAVWGGR